MNPSLHYSGLTLDRADYKRRDEAGLSTLWARDDTHVYPLHQLRNLVNIQFGSAVHGSIAQLREFGLLHEEGSFLGMDGSTAVFAVDCDDTQAATWRDLVPGSEFTDLRKVGFSLPGDQASLLGYTRGLLHWQSQNPFCGVCGSSNRLSSGGHMMRCSSATCEKQLFPRTDPAVIMLVERCTDKGERVCLLGRSPAWPKEVYSTLAGFVETGESLEEAVAREVLEEASISVTDVRYMCSQPWPFPQSIMLGFIATATSDVIEIDPAELAEAHWFSDKQIAEFGNWGDESRGPKLPRPDSIARYLIDSWMKSLA